MAWSSQAGQIYRDNQKFQIKGINWFGFEEDYVIHGLWKHNLDFYLDFLQEHHFNVIRVPFSADLFLKENLQPNPEPINYQINPELKGLSALQILDLLLSKAAARDIYVLLDQHRLTPDSDITELWYNQEISEGDVLQSWFNLVTRYLHQSNLLGVELKNEPHGQATWGTGDFKTDWRLAAERIGNYILSLNPNLLIFVGGIGNNQIDQTPEPDWWGGNLSGATTHPVRLCDTTKLVYTPHVYGPSVFNQPYFDDANFPNNLPDIWSRQWALDLDQAIVIGEWGGFGEGKDFDWHQALGDFLIQRNLRSNFYWSLNPNSADTGGVLEDDWTTPVQWKLDLLARIQGETSQPQPEPSNWRERFLDLYQKLHDFNNGYFSAEGIPYHSVEEVIVEAPDYGHVTTSEAYSYWIWLEALYGRITGDWSQLEKAWQNMETYMIPSFQPTNDDYNGNRPASYAPEWETPQKYPSRLDFSVPVGQDPLASQLSGPVYGMHWLLDVDNWYGFGQETQPEFINTFQRGPQESVWETVPHPSIEKFEYGGPHGFLDLFVEDPNGNYSKQWRYTNAPDADARVVQAIYWANQWGFNKLNSKAAKMGDWLRYSLFDKYFKPIGSQSLASTGGGYQACHYLLSWYYAWGGPLQPENWAFRIGCSHSHSGYQNPLAAWVLSQDSNLSTQARSDWAKSLFRQIQLYHWLQSAEGGIAGGVSNSYRGRYETYPDDLPTFHSMVYDEAPVFHDPPSNEWFGFQAWSMERVIQYYYVTRDEKVLSLITKWINWVYDNIDWSAGTIPSQLRWEGAPDKSFASETTLPSANRNLHVTVESHSKDLGIMANLARCFGYLAAVDNNQKFKNAAETLLKNILSQADAIGYSSQEERADYHRFQQAVYIPLNWQGSMPNGEVIDTDSTFESIRSKYQDHPDYLKIKETLSQEEVPTFRYHRFWAQAEIALAFGIYHLLFVESEEPPEEPEEPPEEPLVALKLTPVNSWVSGGVKHTQYQLLVTNNSNQRYLNVKIQASNLSSTDIWNFQVSGENILEFPDWLRSNGGLESGGHHDGGFISTTEPTFEVIETTIA